MPSVTYSLWIMLLRYLQNYGHLTVRVELTCSGCVGEISVSWRKERVGEYIGEGEKQTDWSSQDRTSSEGESCGREQHISNNAQTISEGKLSSINFVGSLQ